jgi:hypothetical protein
MAIMVKKMVEDDGELHLENRIKSGSIKPVLT